MKAFQRARAQGKQEIYTTEGRIDAKMSDEWRQCSMQPTERQKSGKYIFLYYSSPIDHMYYIISKKVLLLEFEHLLQYFMWPYSCVFLNKNSSAANCNSQLHTFSRQKASPLFFLASMPHLNWAWFFDDCLRWFLCVLEESFQKAYLF